MKKLGLLLIITVLFAAGCSLLPKSDDNQGVEGKSTAVGDAVKLMFEVVGAPSKDEMTDMAETLQKRVDEIYPGAKVAVDESDQISLVFPEKKDSDIDVNKLLAPGKLEFVDSDGKVLLTGSDIKDAQAGEDKDFNYFYVSLEFTDEGAENLKNATQANIGKEISIQIDGTVINTSTVQAAITGGKCNISNFATREEAEYLALLIRSGSLAYDLKEIN